MAEFLIETLVERLKAAKLSVPWVRGLAALGQLLVSAPKGQIEGSILAVSRGTHRVQRFSWLWPCDRMHDAQLALEAPTLRARPR